MDEEIERHMEETVNLEAQNLIKELRKRFRSPPPQIFNNIEVRWDGDSCYVTVATLQEPELPIQVWYDTTLEDESLGFWVGIGAEDRNEVQLLVKACAGAFPNYQTVRSYPRLRQIPLDNVLAAPIAEFCRGPYNGFGVYGRPGEALDLPRAMDFIMRVLRCLPKFQAMETLREIEEIENDSSLEETEKQALINARIGQGQFRDDLKAKWRNQCAVLGCSTREVLRASHIRPWRKCNNEERLDPNNGLLLAAHLDALFDRYLISFNKDGNMMISDVISRDDRIKLGLDKPLKLQKRPWKELEDYLAEHRARLRSAEPSVEH